MITANFFHIKATNGLFYYGLDYVRENIELVHLILARPTLAQAVRNAFPEIPVIACKRVRFLREAIRAHRRGDLLFTPTSHPLPGIDRQWVVMHDAYPFEQGRGSKLKRLLLRWSLALSDCRIAYINRSDAQPFVTSLGVSPDRQFFAPNRFPDPLTFNNHRPPDGRYTIVGLLGTDSTKKNYDQLFTAVRRAQLSSRLSFRVYGHETPYFQSIRTQYPELQIILVHSDAESLNNFMSQVHVLASASDKEGFGRPIAAALLSGLPVELMDRPVFREFFTGGARFHDHIDSLVRALPRGLNNNHSVSYTAPVDVVAAFSAASMEIRRLGAISRRPVVALPN